MRLLNTRITRLLGIRHPIVQGGLNFVGSMGLSAAVANAGGLGLISALRQPSALALREEICSARAMLATNCPGALGVNLTIVPELQQNVSCEECVAAIVDEGIQVVETSGLLQRDVVESLHGNNIKIIHKCSTLCDAQRVEAMGVDAISLDGFECAGLPGEGDIGNWVLQAMGARKLSVPYIASGGVGDGRQLAAALALGASGVNMGTRFMATKEAEIDSSMKQALVNRTTGRSAFGVTRPDGTTPDARPHGVRLSLWSCGPVAALIDDVPTCERLIERMVAEAVDVIEVLPASLEKRPGIR
jgi:nitronate monooxygenase